MTMMIEFPDRPASPGVELTGRGVFEVPFQRIPGRRCFVALDSCSVEVACVNMPPDGDEGFVRRQLAQLLVELE